MKVGFYNHQHLRGGCPGCSQTYVKGMISDAERCKNVIARYYGTDCEFINYTDLGDYPADNVNRPGYKRMIDDIIKDHIDVIITVIPDKISSDINLILDFYQLCKQHHIDFLTANEGKDVMTGLDILLAKLPVTQ